MKKLHFDYRMEIAYSEPAQKCHYTMRCVPRDTGGQRVESLRAEMFPENPWCRGRDSFGNEMLYGSVEERHDRFCFHMEGTVETGLAASGAVEPEGMLGVYRYPHGLAAWGEELAAYGARLREETGLGADGGGGCALAGELMHRLYRDFRYEKSVTGLATTAEEAWRLGRGVCQDYAHILTVLCRMAGIPARYVTGFMMGEGESHAWVEVFAEGRWHGFDPTNDLMVNEDYIRIGAGRDAADCPLNRGIVLGGGVQRQSVAAAVEEIRAIV